MTEPEQWAVELARDWNIECRYCSEYEGDWQEDFAAAIQSAFEEQTRELREALKPFSRGHLADVTLKDYQRARQALKETDNDQ